MPRDLRHEELRVAMVIQSFDPTIGGAQRQVEALAPLLERRGAAVTCFTHAVKGAPTRERRPGLAVRRIGLARPRPLRSASYVAGGALATGASRPSVIHVHDLLSPALIGLLAGGAMRVPVVAKVLSSGPGGDIDRLLSKPAGATRLRAAAARFDFISLSAEIDRELGAWGVPAQRIWRIPNGVDSQRFRPAGDPPRGTERHRLGLPENGPLSVYCGRLAPVKRLDVLIDAFGSMPGHLAIVGDGEQASDIERAISAAGLSGRVTIHAPTSDTAPWYRAADLYLSASTTEGMSNSVLEALASGIPVAASPASGMDELLSGPAGAVAADGSAPALATAARGLLERPNGAGDAARRRALDYRLESVADQLMELYGTVLRRRQG